MVQANGRGLAFQCSIQVRCRLPGPARSCARAADRSEANHRSSWINQVERWFCFLTDQMIRRGVHKSVRALEAGIRAWIENWNANPRPFAWTKTADEILDSLAKYLARISGAGY